MITAATTMENIETSRNKKAKPVTIISMMLLIDYQSLKDDGFRTALIKSLTVSILASNKSIV
ncbi:hypothetical protein DVP68_16485 [Yersinia enterocolitica]|nr:hypothetical protein [Yersinia enterocolitica]